MIKRFALVIISMSIALAACPIHAQQSLSVVTEAVCYGNPEFGDVGLVEFPLMITRSHLQFFRPDTIDPNFYARVFAQVVLYDTAGTPVDSNSTYFSARASSIEEGRTKNQMLFNKLAVLVPPGSYSARVMVVDVASKRSFETLIDEIQLSAHDSAHLTIAGPVLAYQVSRADSSMTFNDRMVKGGLYILNAPAGLFADTDTTAYVYAELYGLKSGTGPDSLFRTSVRVSDSAGTFTRDLGWQIASKLGGATAVTQGINIRNWPAGYYHVHLTAVDPASDDTAFATIPMRILSKLIVNADSAAQMSDDYDSLTLKEKIEIVTFLLSPPEMSTLQKLSDVGKETFLSQYWRGIDENPATAQIENRAEIIRRYRYANKNFTRYMTANTGWMTDMGRIYMKYGHWDQRQDVSAPRVGNPFTIWYYYEIKEGLVFVFEDQLGSRDYKLVHSNAKGERFADDWSAKLREQMLDIK